MWGGSEKKDEDVDIVYARSRLMGLYSFFAIGKKDAGVLWSALNHIDRFKNESITIRDFANTFCPKSHVLFEKMFERYSFAPKKRAFKAAAGLPVGGGDDDGSMGMTADALMELMAKGEAAQAEAKAKYEAEQKTRKEKEMRDRHRPDYVRFLCFFLFFMSITEQEMPLWIYWLWYSLPKNRPTKDNILALTGKIWDQEHFNFSWYDGEVRYIVKVVDPSFNARTFQLTDQRCGGAWSLPFHEMRKELYHNFETVAFFDRMRDSFLGAMNHPQGVCVCVCVCNPLSLSLSLARARFLSHTQSR